jgi:hypothetical protein
MTKTHHSDEVLAWLVTHMDNGGCDMCPSTLELTHPEFAAKIRREWERRGRPTGRNHSEIKKKRGK